MQNRAESKDRKKCKDPKEEIPGSRLPEKCEKIINYEGDNSNFNNGSNDINEIHNLIFDLQLTRYCRDGITSDQSFFPISC